MNRRRLLWLAFCALAAVPVEARATAPLVIQNANDPGVGFNDPTPAQPVGGNPGTTVGQQRLIAFKYAAFVWGMAVDSNPTILISAKFESLTCSATTGILGSASPAYVLAGSGFPLSNAWYPAALGNSLSNADQQPGQPAINTHFNSDIGGTNCLTGDSWYYGLDGNVQSNQLDLVAIALHEFAHGLGFFTTTDGTTGQWGPPSNPKDNVFDHFLLDLTANMHWPVMSNAQRMASAINTRKLVWDGPNATGQVPQVLQPGTPVLRAPAPLGDDLDIGVAAFGPALTSSAVTGMLQQPQVDTYGCTAPTPGSLSGKVALIDRGPTSNPCTFVQKVRNAQAASAIAVVVVDNVAESPPPNMAGSDSSIMIPSVHVTQADGNTLKSQLGTVTLTLANLLAGADAANRPLLYTPNPFKAGSSIPHNDTSTRPHLLMQPDYSTNLGHNLDLTAFFLKDLGWSVPNPNPTTSSADVAITVNGPSNFHPGGDASYSITVNNLGPSDAPDVTVYNVPPSVLSAATNSGACSGAFPCQLGTIPAGGSKSFTAKFNVPSPYLGPSSISNSFTAASAVPDPVTSNNSASATSTQGGGGCNSSGMVGLSSIAALAAIALALGRRRARVRV